MRSMRLAGFALALFLVTTGCSDTDSITSSHLGPTAEASFSEGIGLLSTPTYTEDWDQRRGIDSERCSKVGEEGRPPEGWIHWVFSTKGESTSAKLTLGGTGSGSYDPGPPLGAEVWHFYTPFFPLDGLTATIELFGGSPGPGGGLVISDYCPGEGRSLEVEKTAETFFKRTHAWDIDKEVETENEYFVNSTPKIWLFINGSGDERATWTVDVTYEGATDSDFVIEGTITIENISTSPDPKMVNSIVDDLGIPGYGNVPVSCTDGAGAEFDQSDLPRGIAQGEIWNCTYRVELDEGDAEAGDSGTNRVTVTVQGEDPYTGSADWEFDEPTTELYKTVNVKDVSDLFGEVALGTVTAPNGDSFSYYKDFAWEDYGAEDCGSYEYDNTATIVQTNQSASATLKVNVQCFLDETAYAKGNNPDPAKSVLAFCDAGFSQWGWTNKIEAGTYTWDMWAGAGQCETSKGTHVGTATVTYAGGTVNVQFNISAGFDLLEQHVYAGKDQFPKSPGRFGGPTVAPGQYTIGTGLSGDIWVIVHAVVGYPDPDFGPVP